MITLVSYKNDRFFFPFELGNEQMKTNYYVFDTSQPLLEQWVRTDTHKMQSHISAFPLLQ